MVAPNPQYPYSFLPFGAIVGSTPQVPEFYWNVYSQEERWKFLCLALESLKDYANAIWAKFPLQPVDIGNNSILDSKLGTDVPDIRAKTSETHFIAANTADTVEVSYPTHLGVGTPIVCATAVDESGTNLSVTLSSADDEKATFNVFNNSISSVEYKINMVCWWAERETTPTTNGNGD